MPVLLVAPRFDVVSEDRQKCLSYACLQLTASLAVYGYMNGRIFKIFGAAILIFELLLVVMFGLSLSRRIVRDAELVPILIGFLGFLLVSTVIAVGLIRLQRWAAITASLLGVIWSLTTAAALGHAPWRSLVIGLPVVLGLLTPFYATMRFWPSLKSVDNPKLNSFSRVLRSLNRLRLE